MNVIFKYFPFKPHKMFKISIVPDTNVMLSNLELIKELFSCKMLTLPYTVNFSRTVISELERYKGSKVAARNAIRFLDSISVSLKTELEGKIDERKIEVEIEGRVPIKVSNNDDKILNYCFALENPIFLTNDKAFYLKCLSHNIKTIQIGSKNIKEIVSEILKQFGVSDLEKNKEAKNNYISRIKKSLKNTLLPTIILILQRELGLNYELSLDPDSELEYYLDFVAKNFYLFRNFLPAKTPEIIKNFLKILSNENIEEIKAMIHPICMIFRKSAPEDIL